MFYCDITKVNDEERIVEGYASTEAMDVQGEVVKIDAIKDALPEYMKFANIREMHQPSAVGKAISADVDEKGLYLSVHVVDESAWEKVKKGVYNGFSIGGKKLSKIGDTITQLRLTEISLVDRPANPEAVFNLWKGDGMADEINNDVEKVAERKDVSPKEGESKYGDVDFADEKNNKYPIDTEAHIRAAWNYINKPKNAGKYSAEDAKKIKAKIVSAWKKVIDKDGPPSAEEAKKADIEGSDIAKYYDDEFKNIDDASRAMDALRSLSWLIYSEMNEKESEGTEQIEMLMEAMDKVKEFINSELQEGKKEGTMEYSAKVDDVAKSEDADNIEKAGASISASNKAKMKAMHDHAGEIMKMCKGMMGEEDTGEDAEKMAKSDDLGEIRKAFEVQASEMAKMADRIKELEAMPALSKLEATAIAKGAEVQSIQKDQSPQDMIKGILQSGGQRLI